MRTREFDETKVLEGASDVFWRLGYHAVSVQDLEAATGLGRGSIYNAFGDKQGLFLAALEHYVGRHGATPFRHLASGNVEKGIRSMLEAIVARMSVRANPRGCLVTNTSLEQGTGSPRIEARLLAIVGTMQADLETAIKRARDEGQIPATANPRELAHFFCAVAQSLGVSHKVQGDVSALRDIVEVAMRCWPRPPVARRTAPRTTARKKRARAPGSRRH